MLPKYKRVLLKLSGESLMGDKNFGLDPKVIAQYAKDIRQITDMGVQVALVIGGGNIYRGMNEAETGIERAQGDYMGMLATVINGMAVQSGLEKAGVYTRLQSAIKMEQIAEPYIRRRAMRHLEKGPSNSPTARAGWRQISKHWSLLQRRSAMAPTSSSARRPTTCLLASAVTTSCSVRPVTIRSSAVGATTRSTAVRATTPTSTRRATVPTGSSTPPAATATCSKSAPASPQPTYA